MKRRSLLKLLVTSPLAVLGVRRENAGERLLRKYNEAKRLCVTIRRNRDKWPEPSGQSWDFFSPKLVDFNRHGWPQKEEA